MLARKLSWVVLRGGDPKSLPKRNHLIVFRPCEQKGAEIAAQIGHPICGDPQSLVQCNKSPTGAEGLRGSATTENATAKRARFCNKHHIIDKGIM